MTVRRRLVVVTAVAALVVVTTGALVLGQSSGPTAPETTAATAEAGGGRPAPSGPDTPSATPTPTSALPGSSSTAPPGESTEARASEPDAPAGAAPAPPLPALVTLPLPDTSNAVGSVVAGFPERVLPAAPQSSIASTSVTAEGNRLQAALAARTPLTAQEVLDFYSATLTGLGLVGAPVPAPDGSSALAFTRGMNTVTLTATPVADGSEYTVFGVFAAAS